MVIAGGVPQSQAGLGEARCLEGPTAEAALGVDHAVKSNCDDPGAAVARKEGCCQDLDADFGGEGGERLEHSA